MTLYELTQSYQEVLAILDGNCEDEQVLKDTIECIEESISEKLNNIAKMKRNYETKVNAYDSEIERLQALKTKDNNTIKRLTNLIDWYMQANGLKKTETDLFKFSYRKSTSVVVVDENSVPDKFKKEKVTVSVDKTALKSFLKTNDVPWAVLQENQNLQIK